MRYHPIIGLVAFLITSLIASSVSAVAFPDVPEDHLYRASVEQLVSAGVINGNPDGNFYPERSVNRAEMLKMLYLATGLSPDPNNVRCFPDVQPGSWYESFVCDAAARRFVAGYNDGLFRPAQEVNRVESLKMVQEVFGFDVGDISDYDRDIVKFADVSVSAWYTKYLFNAYSVGILPIAGQDSAYFRPEQILTRGESAEIIYNALYANIQESRREQEEDLQDTQDPVVDDDDDTWSGDDDDDDTSNSSQSADVRNVSFPIDTSGKFDGKKPASFRFELGSSKVVSTVASLQSGQPGMISCTLYLLEETGFSQKYYIGTQEGRSCEMLTALTPGNYQIQLQPTREDVTFTLVLDVDQGDGNDGFSEADSIPMNLSKTQTIPANNFQNWYRFQVTQDDGQRMKVELSNASQLRCIVYSMDDVDLYGFSGPECNQFYTYPSGTYYIAVGREANKASPQTYTLILRE